MKKLPAMDYETLQEIDILEAYLNKNGGYHRADMRKIKRSLRRLSGMYRNSII